MMHHSNHGNIHGGGGAGGAGLHSGPPPPGPGPMHRHQIHQPIPHQPMPPHQMHHDNRHPMGLSQGSSMGGVGQSMGGMGQPMGVPPPLHGPTRPHQIRPMTHHAQTQHHNMPPQMKPMRRPYHMGGTYPAQPPLHPPAYPPPPHPAHHHPLPPPPPVEVSAEGVLNGTAEGQEGTADAEENDGSPPHPPTTTTPPNNPLANSKEKTPMCLVNELARFNKIKHQYRLTSETGPAHKKIFTVTLRLGENEEYTAEGSSIKRAQHAAASAALSRTQYTFPPPKVTSHHTPHTPTRYSGTVMPTVELNALAMKLCKPALYTSVPPVPGPPPPAARFPRFRPPYPPYPPRFHPPHPGAFPPPYAQRGVCGVAVYRVRVSVGERSWPGEGPTPQAARHDAAARALADLRSHSTSAPETQLAAASLDDAMDIKSPVSLVHELALKKGLSVIFDVKSESGPPHMRVFVTTCTVGELTVEGSGNGKKMSKKRAAELMVQEMRAHWPFVMVKDQLRAHTQARLRKKLLLPKKKLRNLVKLNGVASSDNTTDSTDNPISRLAMARHAARARSPQYAVVEERGAPRRREFVVRCEAPPHEAVGVGANKKTAKRRAAHNVLVAMGLETASSTGDAAVKPPAPVTADKPETKLRTESEGGGAVESRQPVPGLLLMTDSTARVTGQPAAAVNGISETAATGGGGGAAGGGEAGDGEAGGECTPGATEQLLYLSQLLGFTVQFSDFPKRNHGSFLSLVSLSTQPPVMCHGAGASTRQSHEVCSRAALRALAAMGLDVADKTQLPSSPPPKGALTNGLEE